MEGYSLSNPEPITTAIMLEFIKKKGMLSNVEGFKTVRYRWSNDNNNGIDNDNDTRNDDFKDNDNDDKDNDR